jgi:hypothetical protein
VIPLVIAIAAALHPGTISYDGVSNVKIGMEVREVSRQVGHRLKPDYSVSPPCGTVTLSKRDRVYGLLARYPGKLVATRNFYTGDPQYELRSGNRKIVFFTTRRVVTKIATGAKPEVDYVEGCA